MRAQTEASLDGRRRRAVPGRCARRDHPARRGDRDAGCASKACRWCWSPTRPRAAPAKRASRSLCPRAGRAGGALGRAWRGHGRSVRGTGAADRRSPRARMKAKAKRKTAVRSSSPIVGRPNAGKSTLINRLLGEDRLLTGPEAGITREFDRGRLELGRSQEQRGAYCPPDRHRRDAQEGASHRKAREALGRRRPPRGRFRRSGRAAARCHQGSGAPGSQDRRHGAVQEGRALIDRNQQMGRRRRSQRAVQRHPRRARRGLGASARRAAAQRFGADRQGARRADRRRLRVPRGLEPPRADRRAQPLVR